MYQLDENANEVWLVVAFTDRETYQKNPNDPAQHKRYGRMRALLDADPARYDGPIIDSYFS